MKYSDVVKLNYDFNKSINILLDKKIDYFLTKSAKKALNAFKYHNAIAIIGPFGVGKSAFLLYLDNYIKENYDYKVVKIVADNRAFLEQFKEALNIKENKSLKEILKEIKNEKIVFLIDEFGRFIENDLLDIQTLVEFINKNQNFKIVVAIHKSFLEYKKDLSKIQGRFENIVFQDEIEESIKILKKSFIHKDSENINKAKSLIKKILNEEFSGLAPLHPFAIIAVAEIFNKFFQNQRSLFSFLFSNEEGGFSEFLHSNSDGLYTLSELYEYLHYLLEVYDISLIDKEAYYLLQKRLKSNLEKIEKDILKAIGVVDIFKLNLNLDEENLYKTFINRYSKEDIKKAINNLTSKNFITYIINKNSFSLVEDLNIDLYKELQYKKSVLKIDKKDINEFISKSFIAKEFFIEYGNEVEFQRVYDEKGDYKIVVSNKDYINEKLISIKTDFKEEFFEILKELKALEEIKEENYLKISPQSKEIIDEMIEDKKEFLNNVVDETIKNSKIIYLDKEYPYSYKTLQKLMSTIVKKFIYKTPKINNYTLIHSTKQQNTTYIKKLFKAMLNNSDKKNLGIEKYPPHKALYLSIIKASGIHRDNKLTYPNNLNFEYIFEFLDEKLSDFVFINELVNELKKEPFCLKENISLFLISVYIIVNKELISMFDDKGFIFELNENILIHLMKNPKKYKLKKIDLRENEKKLFNAYTKLIFKEDKDYNKNLLLTIVRELFKRFNALPNYSKYTTNLLNKAKKLRSAFLSAKDPFEALFVTFPKSLGYEEKFSENEFIKEFKTYFNEIVFSYKKMILELEEHIKKSFLFDKNFPFDISKFKENEETKVYLNAFIHSNSIIELIDNLGILFVNKKSKDFLDSDVKIFKEKIEEIAKKMLLTSTDRNIAKIILGKNDKIIEEVVKIKENKTIDKELKKLKNLSKEEKLLLAYKLIEGIK